MAGLAGARVVVAGEDHVAEPGLPAVRELGREAQRRLLTAPGRTVYSVKRFMGRGVDDVRGEASLLPFGVSGEPGGVVRIGVAGREFTQPAFVLAEK